jgi:Holliday junction resolvase RusA-like endonuclease
MTQCPQIVENIVVHIPAVPVAQPRHRATSFAGKARIYSPSNHPVTAFKATVRYAFQQVYKGPPLTGPLRCSLLFLMPRPKSLIWKRRDMPRLPHTSKPDRDNLDKAVMDALKGIAWIDDAQVCQGELQKWIAAGDEQPHVLLELGPAIL